MGFEKQPTKAYCTMEWKKSHFAVVSFAFVKPVWLRKASKYLLDFLSLIIPFFFFLLITGFYLNVRGQFRVFILLHLN